MSGYRWSLATCVDAHLRRRHAVLDEGERIVKHMEASEHPWGRVKITPALARHYPVVMAWAEFAKTWGVTQGGETVTVPTRKPGNGPEPPVFAEGASLSGVRERFDQSDVSSTNAGSFMGKEVDMLRGASTLYVNAEICERITAVARSAEPEPIFATDLLAPSGLAIFEQPVYAPDLHPDTGKMCDYLRVGIRAIGWAPARVDDWRGPGPGIAMFVYSTADDWKDSYLRDWLAAVADGRVKADPGMYTSYELKQANIGPGAVAPGTAGDFLFPLDMAGWAFGAKWVVNPEIEWAPGMADATVAWQRRWFLTLMRFTWQRLVIPERVEQSPKTAKRVAALIPERRARAAYSVLRLRRAFTDVTRDEHAPAGSRRLLSKRYLVPGYWRRQWYPTLGAARCDDGAFNDESHRLIYIDDYWKGAGTETERRHHVNALVR